MHDSNRYSTMMMLLYEGIASIDLFTEYFHFNVRPCCVCVCASDVATVVWEHFELTAMKWLYHVHEYIIVSSCSVWDCYNGHNIHCVCVVNIWLYHWLLICRAMLDKIHLKSDWNRFRLWPYVVDIWFRKSTQNISCMLIIWGFCKFFWLFCSFFGSKNQPVKICYCAIINRLMYYIRFQNYMLYACWSSKSPWNIGES